MYLQYSQRMQEEHRLKLQVNKGLSKDDTNKKLLLNVDGKILDYVGPY